MRTLTKVLVLAAGMGTTACEGGAQRTAASAPGARPEGAAAPAGHGNATQSTLDGRLRVPPGFRVSRWAADVGGARFMALGADGSVYVSRPRAGVVERLVDANGDGEAEGRAVVVSGQNRPHGLALRDGWLYIANTDGVSRVRLGADGLASGEPEKLNTYSSGGGHWTRTVVFGADGAMYVSIGSTCNVCVEASPDRAAVMRYDADGKNGRLYAKGLRNAVGMAVHPATRQLWVTTHERDNLRPDHQDLPPEEIDILRDGADYGWPYCWGDRRPNPEFNDQPRCDRTEPPALAMQAHSAPLGITFLDRATMFPREWRGDALVAFHGSWNRDEPTGAKVVRIRTRDGRPVGYDDFITGFQGADGRRWGRPVDLLVLRDGSVLLSDDSGGALWRITYAGGAR